jgi:hypothetical protein
MIRFPAHGKLDPLFLAKRFGIDRSARQWDIRANYRGVS